MTTTNHAGLLEPANVRQTTATVTRTTDDGLEAAAEVTRVMDRLDRATQIRVAAFVDKTWGDR